MIYFCFMGNSLIGFVFNRMTSFSIPHSQTSFRNLAKIMMTFHRKPTYYFNTFTFCGRAKVIPLVFISLLYHQQRRTRSLDLESSGLKVEKNVKSSEPPNFQQT